MIGYVNIIFKLNFFLILRPLGPVDKCRERQRHPFPLTISDGLPKSKCFQKEIVKRLKFYYKTDSKPKQFVKKQLALELKLSEEQITNWFKNRRQREQINLNICKKQQQITKLKVEHKIKK